MSIKAINITKKFRNFQALDDVSITVEPGEFLALLGPSGSGKTTLLRIIAGLEIADSGEVFLEGENIHFRPVRERNIGFVFQHYALFRHMTVFENVAFGLKIRPKNVRLSNEIIDKKVHELLSLVHLEGVGHHYPSQLSGGQRQRIALARVLAIEPRVMLLDEPFGALDAKVRKELRHWMRRLHDEMHITTVFVTHDQEEAMEISDRIAILNKGKIEQIGTPEQIWNHPANAFVYDFLGNYNGFIAFKDINENIVISEEFYFPMKKDIPKEVKKPISFFTKIKNYFIKAPKISSEDLEEEKIPQIPTSKYLKLFVRPFELTIHKTKVSEGLSVQATVTHLNMAGSLIKVELQRQNGHILQAEITKENLEELGIAKGDSVWVYPKNYRMF